MGEETWATTVVDLDLTDLAFIQPTCEFVARKAHELFREAEGSLLDASSATRLTDSGKPRLAKLVVRFGDTKVSDCGWPN